eukprot:GHVS01004226.1.p1 GENE.GHVS01004226.1~~GHVS01004226.1.p1  ORF type:complete len:583 (-),score=99.52 GHVS01004226.1:962-2518(-)
MDGSPTEEDCKKTNKTKKDMGEEEEDEEATSSPLPPDFPLKYCIEPKGNVGRVFRRFVMTHYSRLLSTPVGKVVVLLLFVVYIGLAIWGWVGYMQTGLSYFASVAGESYLRDFFNERELYFDIYGEKVDVLFKDSTVKWWDPRVQDELLWIHDVLSNSSYVAVVASGMDRFIRNNRDELIPNDEQQFIDKLQEWLNEDRYGQHYRRDFIFEESPVDNTQESSGASSVRLKAWKLGFFQSYVNDSPKAWSWLLQCRRDVGSPRQDDVTPYVPAGSTSLLNDRLVRGDCYYYGTMILEADPIILSYTLQNMGIALAAIVLIAALAIPTLSSAVLVLVIIVMIDVGMFGYMSFWNVNMNLVSMVNLVMSIGFSIDHTAHVIHAFTHCVGPTRLIRMKECLVVICTPVFHGAISTWLTCCGLATSDKEILVIFFKMMTLVLLFSVAHGVILLPVVLSLIGPMPSNPSQVDVYVKMLGVKQQEEENKLQKRTKQHGRTKGPGLWSLRQRRQKVTIPNDYAIGF